MLHRHAPVPAFQDHLMSIFKPSLVQSSSTPSPHSQNSVVPIFNPAKYDVACLKPGLTSCCGGGAHSQEQLEPRHWAERLCRMQFFDPCSVHSSCCQRKCECTFFCLDCPDAGALCSECLLSHSECRTLQIRRYVYRDVVKSEDISKYLDPSGVQTYTVNHAQAIFLSAKDKALVGPYYRVDSTSCCLKCKRGLREGCKYCSLACKIAVEPELSTALVNTSSGSLQTAAHVTTSTSDSGGGQENSHLLSTPSRSEVHDVVGPFSHGNTPARAARRISRSLPGLQGPSICSSHSVVPLPDAPTVSLKRRGSNAQASMTGHEETQPVRRRPRKQQDPQHALR